MKIKSLLIFIFLAFLGFIVYTSCNNDNDDDDIVTEKGTIAGEWSFEMISDQVFVDTSIFHGIAGNNNGPSSVMVDEIYLYQNDKNEIMGFAGDSKITGEVNNNTVDLQIYVHPDGEFIAERPMDILIPYAKMSLTLDEFNNMSGTMGFVENEIYPAGIDDTYRINALRINSYKNLTEYKNLSNTQGWQNDICCVWNTVMGLAVGTIAKGLVRPMELGCCLYKDGGGYYLFGRHGPGSIVPIWTQCIYYPFEWSGCSHTKNYHFDIKLKDEVISFYLLKELLNEEIYSFIASAFGFATQSDFLNHMEAFYNKYGGFAISLFYDTQNKHIGLYVNHEKGSSNDALNDPYIKNLNHALSHIHKVYPKAGKNISDKWHLTRSPAFVCNTPIVIFYLMGTNKVEYD